MPGWRRPTAVQSLFFTALSVVMVIGVAIFRPRSVSKGSPSNETGGFFASHPVLIPMLAYGQSKTANVLFAVGATRHWADEGITANAVHPGAIATTNLSRYLDPDYLEQVKASGAYQYKTPEQGPATSVLVATSPRLEGVGGRYFQDCNEAPVVDPLTAESSGSGVAAYALDPTNAEALWELSQATLS